MKTETLNDCLEILQAKATAHRIEWRLVERLYSDLLSEWTDDELGAAVVFGTVRNSKYLPDVSELEDFYNSQAREKHGPKLWGNRDRMKFPDSKGSWMAFADGFISRWKELHGSKPFPAEFAKIFKARAAKFGIQYEPWMLENAGKHGSGLFAK